MTDSLGVYAVDCFNVEYWEDGERFPSLTELGGRDEWVVEPLDTYNHTVPSFASTLTGRRTIYDSFSWDTFGTKIRTHRDLRGPYLWDYLSDYHQGFVNVPLLAEREATPDVFVTGILGGEPVEATPPDFETLLREGNHPALDGPYVPDLDVSESVREDYKRVIRERNNMIRYLVDDEPFDVFYGAETVTDRILHSSNRILEDGEVSGPKENLDRKDEMKESYYDIMAVADEEISQSIDAMTDEFDTVLAFSDHGGNWYTRRHKPTGFIAVNNGREFTHDDKHVRDVFPTILHEMGVKPPDYVEGRVIL